MHKKVTAFKIAPQVLMPRELSAAGIHNLIHVTTANTDPVLSVAARQFANTEASMLINHIVQ